MGKREILINLFKIFFFASMAIMFYLIFPINITIKQFLAPIAITFFGISIISLVVYSFLGLKLKAPKYFENVMIGVAGGLSVWVFSTIDFSFKNGFLLGINDILTKVGFSLLIILIGYSIVKKSHKSPQPPKH